MNGKRRWSSLFILPKFQMFFVVYTLFIGMISSFVIFYSNAVFLEQVEVAGKKMNLPDGHVYFQFLETQKSQMEEVFVFTAIGILFLTVVSGLIISHRLAGPLYRMKSDFESMKDSGKLRHIHFRRGDFFPTLAHSFNHMVNRLNGHKSVTSDLEKQA